MVSNKDEKLIRQSTSFYEQAIFYYVRKFFPDALNRYQIECAGNKVEIDIFVPSIKVGIEYDGGFPFRSIGLGYTRH